MQTRILFHLNSYFCFLLANCPIPEHGEYAILTEESLLKNTFPDGTVITYECRRGYDEVSGTGTANCVNGKWTKPDIICRKKDCGLPEAQPHMIFNTSQGTMFGALVKITCEEGYWVTGWRYLQCTGTKWYGKPNCVLATCPIPTKVENGEHSWSSDNKPEYQQTINFLCNTGYTMIGNKTIRCTKTGKYDYEPPRCIAFCPIPKGGENMILTDDSLLKKDFPAGTEVTYKCVIGYEKVSGTGIMICDDGKWTEPDIICRKKDCGLPKAQPHVLFDTSNGTLFGAVVKVTCEEGYYINGLNYKQCLDTGWFGTANCVIFTCSKLTKVENGRHSWNSDREPEYRQTIHFTCNTGYTLFGNKTITCTKTGKYDSEVPRCIADCPKPQHVENTVLTADSLLKSFFPDGTVITSECISGYNKVSGTGIIKCVDGKWTKPDIVCRKNDCGLPEAKPHMLFNTSQGTLFGALVKVTCEEGYRIIGSSSIQCLATGWFGTADCVIVTCPKPTKMENGKNSWNSDNEPEYQQTIHFTCNTGYTLFGNEIIRCTKTGEYDAYLPQCIALTCPKPTKVENAEHSWNSDNKPEYQQTINFTCHAGSYMVGIETIRCTETGEYDYEPPRCIAFCPMPKSGENMILTNESLLQVNFQEGTNITYECSYGFEKETGSEIITCIDGNWTEPDLICKSRSIKTINEGNTPFLSRLAMVTMVCCAVGFFLNILLAWRPWSYDTGEELTPELLQFHTL
ncbi:sushi, von Willebrand factor type A, EGF and pentraxin domain-containing protein 1-like isoform X2 [Gambusia affinis]|uniref:sushi, von Willebrand factor type A, EGF and pentraxin domain-containing protein 1-like isoform X2 n=1 Tax=Gambusia affinis TaxID=33528 RepID=UPI001CDD30DB|nr:sushi, von Willebrand factor type A, EGF and pentraxin domain-containing protein 1-like isoform X2 [Gambusia affinis]